MDNFENLMEIEDSMAQGIFGADYTTKFRIFSKVFNVGTNFPHSFFIRYIFNGQNLKQALAYIRLRDEYLQKEGKDLSEENFSDAIIKEYSIQKGLEKIVNNKKKKKK